MSLFTEEITYLTTERLLGRIATVGPDGMPHIAPVGWRLDEHADPSEGHDLQELHDRAGPTVCC
jgi:hypothetical protein